jgi:hypothetical protein
MSFKDFLTEYKKQHKSMVFDIDDTLITTDAKIKVQLDGKTIKSLTPEEFNTYKLKKGETFNFEDFTSSEVLKTTGKKTKYWQIAQNVNNAVKRGMSDSVLYVLTARPKEAKSKLHKYLISQGLSELKLDNVYTVGNRGETMSVAQLKKNVLKQIAKHHEELVFFDDDTANVKLANELKAVTARLVRK